MNETAMRKRSSNTLAVITVGMLVCSGIVSIFDAVRAADWPQFRGPSGQGWATASDLPLVLGESDNLRWKATVPGRGWSSPVILGDQLWLTTAIQKSPSSELLELTAICLDAHTGEEQLRVVAFAIPHPEPIHDDNSYASPTPVVDQQHVYCHFGTFGTAAIDRVTGGIVWKNESLTIEHQGGPGSSPIPFDDLLIVTCDGADRQFVAALDKQDGTIRWQTARSAPLRADPITHRAFATPLLWTVNDETLLISPGADQAHAYRPATGEELWHIRYTGFSNVPAPVADDQHVFVCTGFFTPTLTAIRRGGRGDVTQTHTDWAYQRSVSTIPSPILHEDHIYSVNENGILVCLDTQTGKIVRKRRFAGNYSASPILAGGKLYFCNESGKVTVLEATEKLEILQVNQLRAVIKASPAVAHNRLYIRTENDVYCFEKVTDEQ